MIWEPFAEFWQLLQRMPSYRHDAAMNTRGGIQSGDPIMGWYK